MAKITARLKKWRDLFAETRTDLDELRDRRQKLLAEADTVRRAPMAAPEVAASINECLAMAEQDAREGIIYGAFALPPSDGTVKPADLSLFRRPIGLGELLALGIVSREKVAARLTADALAAHVGTPMSSHEREAALARLKIDIDDVERVEESLIREAEAAGLSVPRRADANPAIFLAESI